MSVPVLMRRLLFLVFALACVGIALHAFFYLFHAFNPRNPFHVSFAAAGWAVPGHFFAAGLALLLLPLQFAQRLRARWPRLHRVGGWLYVFAVLVGGVSGLMLAPRAQGGWSTGGSFLLLALLWLGSTGMALYCAIRRRFDAHRRWMLRSAALTFAAPTLRLYLGLGLGVFGLGFPQAYLLAAWLCWVVNLLVVEAYLRRSTARCGPARGTGSGFLPAGA